MKKNSTKKLYTVLGIILFISTVNALHVTCQGIGGLVSTESFGIEWLEMDKWMQITVLVGRMVGGLVFSALLYAFTINTIKGYKSGVLFPRKNFVILIACFVALFVYMFCYDNMALVGIANDAVRQIVVDLNTVVCSMTFVVFALMYKIAIKVSEENSLTI